MRAAQERDELLVERGAVLGEEEAPVAPRAGRRGASRSSSSSDSPAADVDDDLGAAQAGRDLERREVDVRLDLAQRLRERGLGDAEHPHRRLDERLRAVEDVPRAARRRAPAPTSPAARGAGPGRTITTTSRAGTTSPGAVPAGSIGVAALRHHGLLAVRVAQGVRVELHPLREALEDRVDLAPPSPRRGSSRGRRTGHHLGGEVVGGGPSPPLVTTRSTPSASMNRNAASRSAGRSPTTMIWETSTPASPRRSETQGPLRSVIRPVRTSVPVTTMPARTSRSWAVRARRVERPHVGGWLDRKCRRAPAPRSPSPSSRRRRDRTGCGRSRPGSAAGSACPRRCPRCRRCRSTARRSAAA